MAFIELSNVKKHYKMGEVIIPAVDGASFELEKGDFAIVAGASGAGKTTVLNLLGGMDRLSSGKIFVAGQEISAFDDKRLIEYRRFDIGFVFQFYNLIQNMTARENVELASQISRQSLDADLVLQQVGLRERKSNFPSQLSGGEQQRVAIARALAKNPKLLLCDEPTGALDYETGKSILKLLQETGKDSQTTIIMITHNTALTAMADKVIFMKSGKVTDFIVQSSPVAVERIEW